MSERERDKEKSSRLQHAGIQCNDSFTELSARTPGDGRTHCSSNWGMDWNKNRNLSPVSSPKRISLPTQYPYNMHGTNYESKSSSNVRSTTSTSIPSRMMVGSDSACSPTPACLRWAEALHYLLNDQTGVELFRRYLHSEGSPHEHALNFWFACEGLHAETDPDMIVSLVKVIHRSFFIKSSLPISEKLRRDVTKHINEMQKTNYQAQYLGSVFDVAQEEVKRLINDTTYSNFLKSDIYLQYVHCAQNQSGSDISGSGSSSSSSSISAREMALMSQSSGLLPTLHEDSELVTNSITPMHCASAGSVSAGHHTPTEPYRLTKDMLLVTQKRRLDVRPKPEAYAGMFASNHLCSRLNGPYHTSTHAYASYSSYNPVSRQDSELQSLSSHSDARTESDNMSLADNSIDGKVMYRSSRKPSRALRESATLNRDPYIEQTFIPRQERIDPSKCKPLKPTDFAALLTKKLEQVKRDQDTQEKLNRQLLENVGGDEQARLLAAVIREKFHVDDENVQDILDQHVSRVWSDTPSRSPDFLSPRAHSPTRRHGPGSRVRRKDRDVISTFSSDSGNVHDFSDAPPGMVKSKSMPEDAHLQERFVRQSTSRRSSNKKTLPELTDSGVSVISSEIPSAAPMPSFVGKETKVLTWLLDLSGKHRSHRPSSATSPNANRHRKTFSQSRSSSLERSSAASSLEAEWCERRRDLVQPTHTAVQLEEARRRLLEDDARAKQNRQRCSGKSHMSGPLSNQSTLRKSTRSSRPVAPVGSSAPSSSFNFVPPPPPPTDEFTTVVFSFCEEQFPYRTKISGKQVTLRQFKDILPKKGNYRYFFKTECDEVENNVIQEEITSDTDLLPLLEGKVMAQVKSVE